MCSVVGKFAPLQVDEDLFVYEAENQTCLA